MRHKPYGIHYCGKDPHRMASAFAEIERLAFLDVGWGGDVALLREYLPETFFNIRLNPVEIQRYTSEELRQNITERVKANSNSRFGGQDYKRNKSEIRRKQRDSPARRHRGA